MIRLDRVRELRDNLIKATNKDEIACILDALVYYAGYEKDEAVHMMLVDYRTEAWLILKKDRMLKKLEITLK